MALPYAIQKGIPLPKRNFGYGKGRNKYPLADMEPGDSFFVPDDGSTSMVSVQVQASKANKRYNGFREYGTTRIEPDGTPLNGIRVFRIK